MKKLYLLFGLICNFFINASAETIIIEVVDFQFSPSNPTVKVGDVVRFAFLEGFHNAVSSSVPAAAAPINSGSPDDAVRNYNYLVTAAGGYNYFCEVHGSASTGMRGQFTATDPLPVTLSGFNIQGQPDKFPLITWTTVTELNVSHFSLRSSVDGIHFREVAKVAAVGNTTQEQTYSFVDRKMPTTHRYVYYQLLIADRDGKETFSHIRQFKTDFAAGRLLVQMGPNPIRRPNQLLLQFNAESSGLMPVNIYDAGGKLVLQSSMRAMPGLNNGHIHICNMNAGIYTIHFSFEGMQETRKLMIE